MAGKIKRVIDQIVSVRGKGNDVVISLTKAKIAMKGINPDGFTMSSPDDAVILQKLAVVARDLGVAVTV